MKSGFGERRAFCGLGWRGWARMALVMLVSTGAVVAQWSHVNLHPTGSFSSGVYGTTLSTQAGGFNPTLGPLHAAVWNGTSAGVIDLHPAAATDSVCLAAAGTQQAGYAVLSGVTSAAIWSGTPSSFVNLHPASASASMAIATDGIQQAGFATTGGMGRAALWNGSAASFVDLHPAGAFNSTVNATTGVIQGGVASFFPFPGTNRAGMWSGSSASFVDLHPTGVASESFVYAVAPGQQAGMAIVGGSSLHAAIWSGSAASFVDLHPSGAYGSEVRATTGVWQAGFYATGLSLRAGLWKGSAATFHDLHAALPSGYSDSWAYAIAESGGTIVIGGAACTSAGCGAAIWTLPSFALTAATTGGGVGDLSLGIVGIRPTASDVWLLASGTPAPAGVGTGAFFGLFFPDPTLFFLLAQASTSFSPLHFPVSANPYAAGALAVGPGTLSGLAGQTFDLTAICYGYADGISGQAPVQRLTF